MFDYECTVLQYKLSLLCYADGYGACCDLQTRTCWIEPFPGVDDILGKDGVFGLWCVMMNVEYEISVKMGTRYLLIPQWSPTLGGNLEDALSRHYFLEDVEIMMKEANNGK